MSEVLYCSFCKKSQNDVRKLIAGPAVNICDGCVEVCVDIIADDSRFNPGPAVMTADAEPRPVSVAAGGLATNCSLCRMPFALDDVLAVPERGVLCPGCVSAIVAAASGRDVDEPA